MLKGLEKREEGVESYSAFVIIFCRPNFIFMVEAQPLMSVVCCCVYGGVFFPISPLPPL